jgi:hypothetical protein
VERLCWSSVPFGAVVLQLKMIIIEIMMYEGIHLDAQFLAD